MKQINSIKNFKFIIIFIIILVLVFYLSAFENILLGVSLIIIISSIFIAYKKEGFPDLKILLKKIAKNLAVSERKYKNELRNESKNLKK